MSLIWNSLTGAVETGLVYTIAFFGVWLMFRIQSDFDVAVDGAFSLGGVVVVVTILHGWNPWLALAAAAMASSLIGLLSFVLTRVLGLILVFVTIVINIAMFSVNLDILGLPDVNIVGSHTIFTDWTRIFGASAESQSLDTVLIAVAVAVVAIVLAFFLKSEIGLALRASGLNKTMARSMAVSPPAMLLVALLIGDGLCGLSGAIAAQQQGFADIQSGTGTLLFGIAAILLGETVVRGKGPIRGLIAVFIGTLLYRFVLALAFNVGVDPNDLNALTAAIVILAIALDRLLHWRGRRGRRLRARRDGLRLHLVWDQPAPVATGTVNQGAPIEQARPAE
jgi:putative ABC transport system permease protein